MGPIETRSDRQIAEFVASANEQNLQRLEAEVHRGGADASHRTERPS